MNIDQLREHAELVRSCIEELQRADDPPSLIKSFPRMGCRISTIAMAISLAENQGADRKLIKGRFGGEQGHAWLQFDGIDIDISANQFDDMKERVIVRRSSEYHSRFSDASLHDYYDTINTSSGWKEKWVYPITNLVAKKLEG
jgi:hypothetical protein